MFLAERLCFSCRTFMLRTRPLLAPFPPLLLPKNLGFISSMHGYRNRLFILWSNKESVYGYCTKAYPRLCCLFMGLLGAYSLEPWLSFVFCTLNSLGSVVVECRSSLSLGVWLGCSNCSVGAALG